jgi:hypothetical protein
MSIEILGSPPNKNKYKKWIKLTITPGSTPIAFNINIGGTRTYYPFSANGLPFKPQAILANRDGGTYKYLSTSYHEDLNYSGTKMWHSDGPEKNMLLTGNAYINDTSFQLGANFNAPLEVYIYGN